MHQSSMHIYGNNKRLLTEHEKHLLQLGLQDGVHNIDYSRLWKIRNLLFDSLLFQMKQTFNTEILLWIRSFGTSFQIYLS
jgi:hypothetical protein